MVELLSEYSVDINLVTWVGNMARVRELLEADPARERLSVFNLDSALNMHCGSLSVLVESPSHTFSTARRKGQPFLHTPDHLLDAQLICSAAALTGHVVTIEDHAAMGGFGSAVLELLARELPRTAVRIHGLPDRFTDHGDVNAQYRAAGIDPESVATETLVWLSKLRPTAARRARPSNGEREEFPHAS
jgi:hypothetical protein